MKQHPFLPGLLAVAATLLAEPVAAAVRTPALVKDITQGARGSSPSSFTKSGDRVYFAADDGLHGCEIWWTDGVSTEILMDINPGAASAIPPGDFVATDVGGTLFFWADDGVHGQELWRSTGGDPPATMVADLNGNRAMIYVAGGLGFFAFNDGVSGTELWKTDGTSDGTTLVADIRASGSSTPQEMMEYNGELYFSADDGVHGRELWKTDGTGATMVRDIHGSGSSSPKDLTPFDGRLFFTADDGSRGRELWSTDGTSPNTALFRDIRAGAISSNPKFLANMGDGLYFSADNGATGQEPWVTDGTNTTLVREINSFGHSGPYNFTRFGNYVYFVASSSGSTSDYGLWRTDGTSGGTSLVEPAVRPDPIWAIGDKLYFNAGGRFFVSDGEPGGTHVLSDLYPDTPSGAVETLAELGGGVLFDGEDTAHGRELWWIPPGQDAPQLLADIHQGTTGSTFGSNGNDTSFVEINGVAYFVAGDGDPYFNPNTTGRELWRTDGTASGTYRVLDINPGEASSDPENLAAVGDMLFFTADDGTHGIELWASDGTEPNTRMVGDITTASPFDTDFGYRPDFVSLNGVLYFAANDYSSGTGVELWRSDGTDNGTAIVADLVSGPGSSRPEWLTVFQNAIFFSAYHETLGNELWRSDGTDQGTALFADIAQSTEPFLRNSNPRGLTVVENTLYFFADVDGEIQLWATDGTPGNTNKLITVAQGEVSIHTAAANGHFFFEVDDPLTGKEPWMTDGTVAGTRLVADINPGAPKSDIEAMAAVGDRVFFVADDGSTGHELWVTDGTTTHQVQDITPGPASTGIHDLTAAHNLLYFRALHPDYGEELWVSDGTTNGTHVVSDIFPGPDSGLRMILGTIAGASPDMDTLFFVADDNFHGVELWKVGRPPGQSLFAPGRIEGGAFSFQFEATAGSTYSVERSSNLRDWESIQTYTGQEGLIMFEDPAAITETMNFYRLWETETP